ncbi:DUF2637 domain-containing protein [Frankia sp. CNm7]|uniref:DUF2637 domain-containing protein n=1 Tax=Frankia nepalensis TaxID=1836974 RepID=A0A937RGX1_9ACTN|nr:DUF2637 domain-containing protein [Frankia nepalensis]MBL7498268.1 DUF2637 domain-containing protein [Frankia nepalensis]MBL7509140.1 DUF2637 domain-containing protein [Frankia nepalensis]MBL7521723.1 DUF2637 domain-containing protein [Frankia nepalensis]MBL7630185.1 DUF2637 domain-containing protein [Frankia nepalensis]
MTLAASAPPAPGGASFQPITPHAPTDPIRPPAAPLDGHSHWAALDDQAADSRGTAAERALRPGRRWWRDGDVWTRLATVAAVLTVAGIAAAVSYKHMHGVALEHGEDPVAAAIIPISVDGLIVAASLTLLADSRAGRRRTWLPYTLLVLGSAASLAANVMHAEPTLAARIIAAWPPLALIGAYELLMRQIRATRPTDDTRAWARRRAVPRAGSAGEHPARTAMPGILADARPTPQPDDGPTDPGAPAVAASMAGSSWTAYQPAGGDEPAMAEPSSPGPVLAGQLGILSEGDAGPTLGRRPDVTGLEGTWSLPSPTSTGAPGGEPASATGASPAPVWIPETVPVPGQRARTAPTRVTPSDLPRVAEPVDSTLPAAPVSGDSPASEGSEPPAGSQRATGSSTPPRRARFVSKRARLAALLATLDPDDPRTDYALARDLAPMLKLHEGTARRYIAELRTTTAA